MKNRTVLFVVVLIGGFTGCSNGTTPAPDPFFGRMTITPPSTQAGTTSAASSYTPPAVVAAPVNASSTQAWQSPPQPNFGQTASVSPPYGSAASSSQPSRPIYLNQNAIEDSVRQPSYTSNNTPSYSGSSQNVAAAGSSRATGSSRAAAPLNISPPSDLQAVNGQPVREQSDIFYRSADGTIPQYGDPRSSFGLTPRARFQQQPGSSVAPVWSSSGQETTSRSPERVNPLGFDATQSTPSQPRISPGTLASSDALEKMLPPIRGYAKPRQTARAQSASGQDNAGSSTRIAMPSRSSRNTQVASTLSPAIRRASSVPTFAPAQPGEPQIMPVPPKAIDIADLPDADVSHIATRPSDSGSSSGTRRLNYEAPATDRTPSSPSTHYDAQVRPVSFTPTILYSHNENYSRLRGELEYSEIEQRWKLRYISINEEGTDDYGGSVILSETSKLSGFERGDFVEVCGRILSGPQDDWGYARAYEVQEIKRIR